MVAEKIRSLLRFGARSTRHKDVFDVYCCLRIKGIDAELLNSCIAEDIFGNESMREEDWADVRTRLEKVFSDRCCIASFPGRKAIGWSFPRGR